MNASAPAAEQRRRIRIGGRVQGVGFRPFIYRLAKTYALIGWVGNTADGVVVEIQGRVQAIDEFLHALRRNAPIEALINSLDIATIACSEEREFSIVDNVETAPNEAAGDLTLPLDIAVCEQCRRELFDPDNRRYRHPFIACCDCGPRWSALTTLPWNRANTALAPFSLCENCNAEYTNAADRRLHAQNNCCPNCGPQLSLWNRHAEIVAEREAALSDAVDAL
ncbi:MAG TPA: acylphosphatase, partial [Spongiibacteraceae bacterium]|nr:acylphosphatase [Spongiibacteraceae bacterium]